MHEMSFWELLKNSPEWVNALAAVIFGFFSTIIILWQVLLMRRQGKISARLLTQQNLLIRWQHEHEWVYERNRVRLELRDLTQKVYLAASCLTGDSSGTDMRNWDRLCDLAYELSRRLSALDLSIHSAPYDDWYAPLDDYIEGVLNAIAKNGEFAKKYDTDESAPTVSIVKKIEEMTKAADPIKIQLDLETSIRMDFLEFKQKWDQDFPSVQKFDSR